MRHVDREPDIEPTEIPVPAPPRPQTTGAPVPFAARVTGAVLIAGALAGTAVLGFYDLELRLLGIVLSVPLLTLGLRAFFGLPLSGFWKGQRLFWSLWLVGFVASVVYWFSLLQD